MRSNLLMFLFWAYFALGLVVGDKTPEERRVYAITYFSMLALYLCVLLWAIWLLGGAYKRLEVTLDRVRESEEKLKQIRQRSRRGPPQGGAPCSS